MPFSSAKYFLTAFTKAIICSFVCRCRSFFSAPHAFNCRRPIKTGACDGRAEASSICCAHTQTCLQLLCARPMQYTLLLRLLVHTVFSRPLLILIASRALRELTADADADDEVEAEAEAEGNTGQAPRNARAHTHNRGAHSLTHASTHSHTRKIK